MHAYTKININIVYVYRYGNIQENARIQAKLSVLEMRSAAFDDIFCGLLSSDASSSRHVSKLNICVKVQSFDFKDWALVRNNR